MSRMPDSDALRCGSRMTSPEFKRAGSAFEVGGTYGLPTHETDTHHEAVTGLYGIQSIDDACTGET